MSDKIVSDKERLQKFLARAGVASRRKSEDLITQGRVRVNGVVAELGSSVTTGDEVKVDGTEVQGQQKGDLITYMLNKPAGYVTTLDDEKGRKTVMELLPDVPGLHPVGRLDMESEGLLLLTTDGELTQQLTHPKFGHEKTYRVWTDKGTLGAAELGILERGVELEDGKARAIVAKLADGGCELVLGEGRKRQVRRMVAAVGYRVTRLVRTKVGGLELNGLTSGQHRELDADDFAALGYTRK